jgi:hypothetical protein
VWVKSTIRILFVSSIGSRRSCGSGWAKVVVCLPARLLHHDIGLARHWDAEHGLASVVLCGERDDARRGDWFLAAAPPSVGGNLVVARVLPFPIAVVVGANEAPVLRHLG